MLKPGDSGDAGVLVFKSQRFASDERLRSAFARLSARLRSRAVLLQRPECLASKRGSKRPRGKAPSVPVRSDGRRRSFSQVRSDCSTTAAMSRDLARIQLFEVSRRPGFDGESGMPGHNHFSWAPVAVAVRTGGVCTASCTEEVRAGC